MLLSDDEVKRLRWDDRRVYERATPEAKLEWADRFRNAGAEQTAATEPSGSANDGPAKVSFWLMIGGVILILIGFFYNVGVGSEFDRVVNLGKMGEKFAFLFTGLGTLITGSIFWNADRIVKAAEAR
tara:strand:+ start:1699 stop:2079 length:381 start_codon:yes stop_codon:yes gene_type:complete